MADIETIKAKYSTLQDIIRYGNRDEVQLAMENIHELDIPYDIQEVYNVAISRSKDELYKKIAKWAISNGAIPTPYIPTEIVGTITPYMGYIPKVSKIWTSRGTLDITIDTLIKKYGDLETIIRDGTKDQIDFAMSHVSKIRCDYSDVANEAAKKGYLNIVKWAVDKGANYWDGMAINAAIGGHLDIIKWAADMGANKWSSVALSAAIGGHLDIIKYAVGMGAKPNWDRIARYTAPLGHLDIIKYAVGMGANNWDEIAYQAAIGGHLDIVEWAVSKGDNNWDDIAKYAVEGRQQNIIDYINSIRK